MSNIIHGLILAGGQSKRMGHDKTDIVLGDQTLLQRSVAILQPQVSDIAISCNAPSAATSAAGFPVLPDRIDGHRGPLAGLHAGLCHWPGDYVCAVAVDLPFLPADLVARLSTPLPRQRCHYVDTDHGHALALLCPPGLLAAVTAALEQQQYSVKHWLRDHGKAIPVAVHDQVDPGFNINTPEDLAKAQARLENSTPE